MKRPTRLVSAFAPTLLAALLFGCVSTSFTASRRPDATTPPPVAPETVKVLAAAPTIGYRTLGEITADVSGFPSTETILSHVRQRAASIGANAVIWSGTGYARMTDVQAFAEAGRLASVTFTAIRMPEGSAREHQ